MGYDSTPRLSRFNMSLEKSSMKRATLLAIVTVHRIQNLSKIGVLNITVSTFEIILEVPKLIKTSKLGIRQAALYLPYFIDRTAISPAYTLNYYID